MDNHSTVRAWKDELYRQSLSTEEQMLLPVNPIGEIELTETELLSIYGGVGVEVLHSRHCGNGGGGNSDGGGDSGYYYYYSKKH